MIGRTLDRIVGVFSPARGALRMQARAAMSNLEAFASTSQFGYDAGKLNRLTKHFNVTRANENAVPREQIQRLRWMSWDLYRNNPNARKIVNTLNAKVIGCGPRPQSQATTVDGGPHADFRDRAQQIWTDFCCRADYRGKPGYGGQTLTDLMKVAFRGTILGGDTLARFRVYPDWRKRELACPVQVQLIHAERLIEATDLELPGLPKTHRVFRGIEVNNDGIRKAYHLLKGNQADPQYELLAAETIRVPASEVSHLYVADDVDQLRGVPWFAPALMQMRDTNDYQFNELKASAIASCVVMGYTRSTGQTQFGLTQPTENALTDADGNKLTAMQPGMILDLGQNGKIEGFNPSRPTTNAEAWIQHMQRTIAAAFPGVKSSTITGDYRNSSFSSERSADNDAWPELEGIQDWFYANFCQVIYERVITESVVAGLFDDIVRVEEFADRKADLLSVKWQGPVQRLINPTDEIKAARERIAAGISTPQIEAAALGHDWRSILKMLKEFKDYATDQEIPDDLIEQFLGLDPKIGSAEEMADAKAQQAKAGGASVKKQAA